MPSRSTAKEGATRVYQYGIVPTKAFPEAGIEELRQLKILWNSFVEIAKSNRAEWDAARYQAEPEYQKIRVLIDEKDEQIKQAYEQKRAARAEAGTKDPSHPLIAAANAEIKHLKSERKELWQQAKPFRISADKKIDKKALNKSFNDNINTARRNSPSQSYSNRQVRDDFLTARDEAFKDWAKSKTKSRAKLQFHRFDGTGYLFYPFRQPGKTADGMPFAELFARDGRDERPFILLKQTCSDKPSSYGKKTRYGLRIKVAGGRKKAEKVYTEFDLIMHRPIPAGAQIQNAKVLRKRTGDRFTYSVSFTVRQQQNVVETIQQGEVLGIDIGFREIRDHHDQVLAIRVAAICSTSDNKRFKTIDIPEQYIKKNNYLNELKGQLDESATILGNDIKPLLKGCTLADGHNKKEFIDKIANPKRHVTLSFEQAYKLGGWLVKHERGLLPEAVERAAMAWWRQYQVRYRESHNLRKRLLEWKRDFYRNLAIELVREGLPIGIEEIDWSELAEVKDKDTPLSKTARANRFFSSPSILLDAIKNAAKREGIIVKKVDPAYTSKTCHHCDKINDALKAELTWQCSNCHANHDRDENAAINIAKKALKQLQSELLLAEYIEQ